MDFLFGPTCFFPINRPQRTAFHRFCDARDARRWASRWNRHMARDVALSCCSFQCIGHGVHGVRGNSSGHGFGFSAAQYCFQIRVPAAQTEINPCPLHLKAISSGRFSVSYLPHRWEVVPVLLYYDTSEASNPCP